MIKHFNFGGTERYSVNLANELVKMGIIVAMVGAPGPYAKYISPKVKVFYAPVSRKGRGKYISERIILKVAAKFKSQLIHAQCRNSLQSSQMARFSLGIPVVCHEHLTYRDQEYSFVANELDQCADSVITVGPYTKRNLISHGYPSSKIKTILNGVSLTEFRGATILEKKAARESLGLKDGDKVILCLSRIVPQKGIEDLVDAFKLIAPKLPDAKLLIAGDDEWNTTKPVIEQKILENNLRGRVFLFPAQFDIKRFHHASDVFCYPAISKGMAVLEAMASTLPIVAKQSLKKPLVAEDSVSGLLVKKPTPKHLSEKLTTLLIDRRLSRLLGKNARNRVRERFNLADNVRMVIATYSKLLARKTKSDALDSRLLTLQSTTTLT